MRLVVLIDNCTINGKNLKGEGGASYYIEDEDKKFLLDTGASGLFMENAKNLDINLDDIDTVVLSHGHYDHAGGIKDFIESRDDKINIICHPLSFNKKKKGNTNMGAPYRKDEIIKLANVNFSDKPVKVSKNITYLGQIPDIMDFENRKLIRKWVKKEMKNNDIIWTTTDATVREIGPDLLNYKHVMQLMELVEYVPKFPLIPKKNLFKFNITKYAHHSWKIVVPEINRAYIQKVWWDLEKTPKILPK